MCKKLKTTRANALKSLRFKTDLELLQDLQRLTKVRTNESGSSMKVGQVCPDGPLQSRTKCVVLISKIFVISSSVYPNLR